MNHKTLARFTAIFLILITGFSIYQSMTMGTREVVIYTSVDQLFSEPILQGFERETGIKVRAVYDVEAAKTTGLVNRLIAEKNKPLADVWWNGEIIQTILLKEMGVLTQYSSPEARNIPSSYVDTEGYWTGFGGRARVLLVNTELISPEDYPTTIHDLVNGEYEGETIGMAYPIFGTTATHAAALYSVMGEKEAPQFFTGIRDSSVRIVNGNGVVRDLVVNGELVMGLTDTDDSIGAIKRGASVEMVFLDQGETQMGTLKIPNTVAVIHDGPNPEEARVLVDYLLSVENVENLVRSGWIQIPLRELDVEQMYFDASSVRGMDVDYGEVYVFIEQAKRELTEIFVR